jgi:hypothetical protein
MGMYPAKSPIQQLTWDDELGREHGAMAPKEAKRQGARLFLDQAF